MISRDNSTQHDKLNSFSRMKNGVAGNCATLQRPLPESKTDRICVYEMEYGCDPWEKPESYDTNSLFFKIHLQNLPKPEDEIRKLSSPPSPILKRSTPTLITPVIATSTPINAVDMICIENITLWSQKKRNKLLIRLLLHHHKPHLLHNSIPPTMTQQTTQNLYKKL